MQLSELIITLQNEILKSYNFISETKGLETNDKSILHINIEKVELDIPITLNQKDMEYLSSEHKDIPMPYKKLLIPFSHQQSPVTKKSIKGKTIIIETMSEINKLDERTTSDVIGRLKISFKPIIS